MKTLGNILTSTVFVAAACTLPIFSVGCGSEAVSEGEVDPEEVVSPSTEGKDDTLHELGFDIQKRGASGNVNYLAGHIPVGSGSIDDVKSLVLSKLAATYQLTDGTDLQLVSEQKDESGFRFLRFQQTTGGTPVTQGHIAVNLGPDGAVQAILGELVPRARAVAASGDGRATVQSALAAIGAINVIIHDGPSPAVFTTKSGDVVTSWTAIVEYKGPEGRALEDVFVSQLDGALLARYSKINDALSRQVNDLGKGCIITGRELPGRLVMSEGGTSSDSAAMGAYEGTGNTYWFYKNFFGRDSYDGKGAKLVSSVHSQFLEGTSCSSNNAVWTGPPYNQMAYGDGDGSRMHDLAKSYDVTGHELTHAVTGSTSQLVYQDESGALNEGMSDIHGVTAYAWKRGGGTQAGNPAQLTVDAHTWLVGETVAGPAMPGGALRFMNDPAKDGYSADYYPSRIKTTADHGGVHGNSGIANLAFYLLSQGGSHPRQKTTTVVTGIGMDKAVRIFFKANTSILTPNSDFLAARNATAQAAQSLFGTCSAEWTNTQRAWDAVGVPGSWTPCTAMPPPGGGGGGGPMPPPAPPTMGPIPEVKPNSSFLTAMNVAQSSTIIGKLAGARDSGYFKVKLAPGASLTAHLDVAGKSDFDLYIYNSNGVLIAAGSNGRGLSEEFKVVNSSNAAFTRYVRVVYYSGALGDAAPYQLKLTF